MGMCKRLAVVVAGVWLGAQVAALGAELVLFANGTNIGVTAYGFGGTELSTNASGGFADEPYLRITSPTSGDKIMSLGYPTNDLTAYTYLSLAYRGGTNGETASMTVGGVGGQSMNYPLTPATDWRVINMPFRDYLVAGHWFDITKATALTVYLPTPIPTHFDLSHIVFSSEPWQPAGYTFPPEVVLTGPAVTNYLAPATFTISAAVTDTGHGVGRVEFFTDNALTPLGTSTQAPYTFTWSDVPAGKHVVSARAFDTLGNWNHSTPLTITVTNMPLAAPSGTLPVMMYRRACVSGFVFAMVSSNSAALKADTAVSDVSFDGIPADAILLASNGVLRAVVPDGLPDGVVTVRVDGAAGTFAEMPMRLYSIAPDLLRWPILLTNLTSYGANGASWHGFNTNGVEGPAFWNGGHWNDVFRTNAFGSGNWVPGVWAIDAATSHVGNTWLAMPAHSVNWDFLTMKTTYDLQTSTDTANGWDGTWQTVFPGVQTRTQLYLNGPFSLQGGHWLRMRFTDHTYGQSGGPPPVNFTGVYGERYRGALEKINGLIIWGDSNTANDFQQTLKQYFPIYHALRVGGDDPVVLPFGRASDSVASLTRTGYDSFSYHIDEIDYLRAMRFVGIDIGINDRESATPVNVYHDALVNAVRLAFKNDKVPIFAWVPFAPSWGHAYWHQMALCDAADEVAFDYKLPPGPDQWAVIYSDPAAYVSDGVHHTAAGGLAHVAGWADTHARLLNRIAGDGSDPNRPRLVGLAATNVLQTTAYLNALLTSTGAAQTAVSVYWGASDGGEVPSAWAGTNSFGSNGAPPPVSYSHQAAGLTPGSNHAYRYFAQNASGGVWSAVQTFTTRALPSAPAVNNNGGATDVLGTSATLNGRVTVGEPAPLIYICWDSTPHGPDTNAWPQVEAVGAVEPLGAQAGAFSRAIGGLTPGGAYHYRCFATNAHGGAWSDTTNFTTEIWTHTFTNSGNWNVAGNWLPNTVPATAADTGGVGAGKTATANADLGSAGNRPTIVINPGGRVSQTVDLSTPIVLNGGVFKLDGGVSTYSFITLNAASTIEKAAHCCNGKNLSGAISGGGKLTFLFVNAYNNDFNITGNNTFSGGVDFLAGPTYTGRVHVGVNALSTNGPPAGPNVVRVSTNVELRLSFGGSITRDFTLDGGTLSSWNNGVTVQGTLTLTADSRVMTAGFVGGGSAIQGAIVGPYALTVDPSYQDLTLKTASPDWTGGMVATGSTYKTVVQVAGAQGAGPLRLGSSSTLAFDATTAQDWSITNTVWGQGTLKVEDGAGNQRLTFGGAAVAPGGVAAAAGKLTVDGKAAFTNVGSQTCTLTLDVRNTNQVAGTDFDQLVVDHGDAGLADSIANCDLVVNVTPTLAQLNGQLLTVVAAPGADFTGKGFRSVTWVGEAGELRYRNGSVRALFSTGGEVPVVNNDGGATNIRATRALLRGQVTQGNPPPDVYICYGLTNGGGASTGDWEHVIYMDVQDGDFSASVTGLLAGSNYFYRCFATNDHGADWADEATPFTTYSEYVFTFTNHNANWSLGSSWSPAGGPPLDAGERGVVPTSMTAIANADLGTTSDRPTIRIESGGRVNQTAADLYTPIALNGGVFHNTGHMNTQSPFTLLADSAIEKTPQCCNSKGFSGAISGGGKLTFTYMGKVDKDVSFSGNNTFTGGVDFLSAPGYTGEVYFSNGALGQNGPPAAPNTLRVFPNFKLLLADGGTVVRDFTLAGGALVSRFRNLTVTGTLTLTAASQVATEPCCNGGGLTLAGPVVGGYELVANPTYNDIWFKGNSPLWTGGLVATGSTFRTVIQVPGAQGAGPLRVGAASTLAFDALADQDWFVTNALSSVSGATNATIRVESGPATTNTLTVCGRTVAPGGTDGIGILKIDGRFALAAAGAPHAVLDLRANGTNAFDGANAATSHDQLRVNGSRVDFGGQELRVTLGYAPQPGDVLDVVLNGGDNAIAGTFLGLPEGGTLTGRSFAAGTFSARITYQANADGGAVGNDVRLYDLALSVAGGTVLTVR